MKELAKELGVKVYSRNELVDLTEKKNNLVSIVKFTISSLEIGGTERLSVEKISYSNGGCA